VSLDDCNGLLCCNYTQNEGRVDELKVIGGMLKVKVITESTMKSTRRVDDAVTVLAALSADEATACTQRTRDHSAVTNASAYRLLSAFKT